MTVAFTVFDSTTGEILRTGNSMTVEQAQLQAGAGERVITVGSNPDTQAVSNPGGDTPGVIIKADTMSISMNKIIMAANGTDSIVYSNVPVGAIAKFTVPSDMGVNIVNDVTVTDGVLTVTSKVPGAYSVLFTLFPFQDYRGAFNAS